MRRWNNPHPGLNLEEDTFIPIGQFLARYIARGQPLPSWKIQRCSWRMGQNAYVGITGIGPYCVENPAYLQQLGAGKTIVTDATINDFLAASARQS